MRLFEHNQVKDRRGQSKSSGAGVGEMASRDVWEIELSGLKA